MTLKDREPDGEKQKVTLLASSLYQTSLASDPVDVVDLYVSLKSKHLAILAGPAGTGKVHLIECLGRLLVGDGCDRCQMMLGHPWWAGGSENLVFFTNVQNRFNVQKLLVMIEEAGQPENQGRLYLGCMARISPAELMCFFDSIASQMVSSKTASPSPFEFLLPGPWPANLLLVGTLDTDGSWDWEGDLIAKANFFYSGLPPKVSRRCRRAGPLVNNLEADFLQSAIREQNQAYRKLHAVLARAR